MALNPPFVVQIERKPGGTFGGTRNAVRIWLGDRHIQPASFNPVTNARSGVGLDIGFNIEDEAEFFEQAFG